MHKIVGLIVALALSLPAWGADIEEDLLKGGYLGFGLGKSQVRWDNPDVATSNSFCRADAIECHRRPETWKLYGGYMFNRFVGIEASGMWTKDAGFTYLDTIATGDPVTPFVNAWVVEEVHVKAFGLAAVGVVPIGPVAIRGRIGLAAVTGIESRDFPFVGPLEGTSSSREVSTTQPFGGVGVSVRFGKGFFVRGDWDRLRAEAPSRGATNRRLTVDMLTVGAGYQF
jgi:hypothetical protein